MVAAIAESKDLLTYSFDKLRCSVLAHEVRINKEEEKVEDNAFQVRGKQMSGLLITEVMVKVKMVLVIVVVQVFTRGRGGRGDQGEERPLVRRIRCYYCKSYGHIEARYWNKEFDEQE